MSLSSNKPIWAFWITYSVLSGIFFGVFYITTYLLALQWWVAILVILAIGMIWGSYVYTQNKLGKKVEKETAQAEEKTKKA